MTRLLADALDVILAIILTATFADLSAALVATILY